MAPKGYKLSEETKKKIAEWNKGRKRNFSQEAIENIRKAARKRKGKCFNTPMSEYQKRRIREANSKPKSDEHKRKISDALKGRENPKHSEIMKSLYVKGSLNLKPWPKGKEAWNKGKRYGQSPKRAGTLFQIWAKRVKERDGYKCTQCASTYRLAAHHIIPWKEKEELRFELSNGISLCASCHAKLEGYKKGHKPSAEVLAKIKATKRSRSHAP